LRTAFDALQQIGGPEATDLMLNAAHDWCRLRRSRLANIWSNRRRDSTAREAVKRRYWHSSQVLKGKLAGWDMGPLFPVLAKYGDPTSVQELQSQWKYYATLSLAGAEGGAGIPALIRQVQEPAAGSKNDFAFQMLAQQASGSPDATAALIEQDRMNQIPESAWRKIVIGLAGDQYFMGTQPTSGGETVPGLKTYHIEMGNQNFYSLPVRSSGADPQIDQRVNLIDQLLAATSNSSARQALQHARASLAGSTEAK
jgi:hypothetical protein